MTNPLSITDLKSLGPASKLMLAEAGIVTVAQIVELGSVRAYYRVKQVCPRASLNLLWALESAITGEPWQQVARAHRTSLLLALDALSTGADSAGIAGTD
ncbi:TfoX/Sxy family protein [Burkholderiaceae bacterium DAT-1]|nr:TfoX/Sxy family protein [Burkholderiaceae bacterium DAT-1]